VLAGARHGVGLPHRNKESYVSGVRFPAPRKKTVTVGYDRSGHSPGFVREKSDCRSREIYGLRVKKCLVPTILVSPARFMLTIIGHQSA